MDKLAKIYIPGEQSSFRLETSFPKQHRVPFQAVAVLLIYHPFSKKNQVSKKVQVYYFQVMTHLQWIDLQVAKA